MQFSPLRSCPSVPAFASSRCSLLLSFLLSLLLQLPLLFFVLLLLASSSSSSEAPRSAAEMPSSSSSCSILPPPSAPFPSASASDRASALSACLGAFLPAGLGISSSTSSPSSRAPSSESSSESSPKSCKKGDPPPPSSSSPSSASALRGVSCCWMFLESCDRSCSPVCVLSAPAGSGGFAFWNCCCCCCCCVWTFAVASSICSSAPFSVCPLGFACSCWLSSFAASAASFAGGTEEVSTRPSASAVAELCCGFFWQTPSMAAATPSLQPSLLCWLGSSCGKNSCRGGQASPRTRALNLKRSDGSASIGIARARWKSWVIRRKSPCCSSKSKYLDQSSPARQSKPQLETARSKTSRWASTDSKLSSVSSNATASQ
mmetsp:Transcript_52633/g.112293  ORF Transcript_52633/g.112293 Transcript_52633/m.112293 type:complete len:375 (+) Transcript_52633:148-1272(+)